MPADIATPRSFGRFPKRSESWWGFFANFVKIACPYWSGEEKWSARILTLALVALTVAQVVIPVALNFWMEALFNALEKRAFDRFLALIGILLIIIVGSAIIGTSHLCVKRRLQVAWRSWLTRRLMDAWMTAGHHYRLLYVPGEHDNPDGRIAEDARIATEYAVDLAHSLFYCVLLLASFIDILWGLSGPPEIGLDGIELYIPGHLVWVALLYSLVATYITLRLGRPLVRATDRRQTFEANFRFGLVNARENALAIALVHGEEDERKRFQEFFKGAAVAWNRQTAALSRVFLYTESWSVLSQVFPVLVAAPRYIAGAITLGVLMQTAQAFQQMIAALAWPTDNLAHLADWRASVERVQGLHDSIERLEAPASAEGLIDIVEGDKPVLSYRHVSVTSPEGKLEVSDVSATIASGDWVLVSGEPSAADKLLKAGVGLWPWGSGRIELPKDIHVFFMPRRPYLPIGTLRDALVYPGTSGRRDEQIHAALKRVGLAHLIARLDESQTWEQVLGGDELQRLGFARLLLHRPSWIVIREATDALDPKGVHDMMQAVKEEIPNATVITIGHPWILGAYHKRRFALERHDGYVVVEETTAGQSSAIPA